MRQIVERLSAFGLVTALIVMLLSTSAFYFSGEEHSLAPTSHIVPIESLPLELGRWRGRDVEGLGVGPLEILQLTRYVRRIYTDPDGHELLLYIGYWDKQSGEHQAAKHSPAVCLPSNGWSIERLGRSSVSITGSKPLMVNRVVGQIGQSKMLFHYWFFAGTTTYAVEWQALLKIVFETFFEHRSDGGIIEISSDLHTRQAGELGVAAADESARDFIAVLQPALNSLLNK